MQYKIECDMFNEGQFVQSESFPKTYNLFTHAVRDAARAERESESGIKYRVVTVVPTPVPTPTVGELVDKVLAKATVYIVDMRAAELRVLAGLIADGDVQKLLPFQTSLHKGTNHVHIVNKSAYTVETNYHTIEEGDSICYRAESFKHNSEYNVRTGLGSRIYVDQYAVATCPGCLAKAKRIIVEHILEKEYV